MQDFLETFLLYILTTRAMDKKKREEMSKFLSLYRALMKLNIVSLIIGLIGSIFLKKNIFLLAYNGPHFVMYLKLLIFFAIALVIIYGFPKRNKLSYYAAVIYPVFTVISVLIEPISLSSLFATFMTLFWVFLNAMLLYFTIKARRLFLF